jgi:5'-3' exonuclease
MTCCLVDADIVAYRTAASCEPSKTRDWVEPIEVAIMRADELMARILHETNATSYKAFLTGSSNFRLEYNPEYKANRKDVPRPRWLQDVREHLVMAYNASVEDGQEADDAMGILQCQSEPGSTTIATIDKDLLMIPGFHYNFVTGEHLEQHPIPAIRRMYYQLLMGDRTDNVFGFDGIARQTIPKKLEHVFNELASYDDELDMFDFVRGLYDNDELLLMNMRCLWISRKENEDIGERFKILLAM